MENPNYKASIIVGFIFMLIFASYIILLRHSMLYG